MQMVRSILGAGSDLRRGGGGGLEVVLAYGKAGAWFARQRFPIAFRSPASRERGILAVSQPLAAQAGQSLVESCIVIGILCLLLMALFQLSQLFMAQEIVHYAAGRGARAKAVGFNDFMVFKTIRVGAIANAGKLTFPELAEQTPYPLTLSLGSRFQIRFPIAVANGPAAQRALEHSRIPLYLGAYEAVYLPSILNYENWDTIFYSYLEQENPPRLDFYVRHYFPLTLPLHRAFYAGDSIPFTGRTTLENHYPLYLDVD